MAGEDRSDLESLIEKSVRQEPHFQDIAASASKTQQNNRKTLTERLLPLSAAVANAALSLSGNPVYASPVVGAITYFITDISYKSFKNNKRVKEESIGPDTASSVYNRLFTFKFPFSLLSGSIALMFSVTAKLSEIPADLPADTLGFYSGLLPLFPHLTSEIAFSITNGIGAYALLSGLEKILHSQSLTTMKHVAFRKFHKMRLNRQKEAEDLEHLAAFPHSKEKEKEVLLQLAGTYLEAGQGSKALDAYKRLLTASTRADEFVGISDWLIKQEKERPYAGKYHHLRAAMHEFVTGDLIAAHRHLTDEVAADQNNRQLRRIRALFFGTTGNSEAADLEMRIYEELLKQDPQLTFRVLGESRNEVFVPADETAPFPDIYIKRSRNKASLDEEVANIAAFSKELPGMLPKVVRQGFDGEYHYIVLESMGNATMFKKALTGNLSHSDVKAVLDLLVKVVVAGQKLTKEGKIKANEPMTTESYIYSNADMIKAHGLSSTQQNLLENRVLYFVHRLIDIFALSVEKHNGVILGDGFESVQDGALVLSSMLLDPKSYFNATYTDFTPRNIIFDSESGNLKGKVDWEQVRILPFLFEVVNILGFYGVALEPVPRADALEHLIKKLEHELHINGQVVMRQYHAAAALRHLELTGYMSRDSTNSPAYIKAQVHNYFMARFHLFEAKRHASGKAKGILEKMYAYLEKQPILKDEREQRQLELEVRRSIMPSMAYAVHELTQKRYWHDFFKGASPAEILDYFSQKGFKGVWHDFWHSEKPAYRRSDPALAIFGHMLIGVPAILTAIGTYGVLSYAIMRAIMPALSR